MSRFASAVSLSALALVLGHTTIAHAQQGERLARSLAALSVGQGDLATARTLISQGKFNEAVVILTKLVKERADSPVPFFERGRAYFALRNFPAAEADFGKAIDLKKTAPNGYFNRGIVRMQTSNWAGAIADFSEVITIAPKARPGEDLLTDSRANRAFCYLQTKRFAEAIRDCDAVVEVDGKRADIFLNRAYAYSSLSPANVTAAIADYTKALGVATDNGQKRDAYLSRADLYIGQSKFAEAAADYTEGLKFDTKNAAVYGARAAAYFQLGKFAEAVADYDQLLAISPGDTETYKNRAAVKARLKDWKGAIVDYSVYLQKVPNPSDADVFRFRGTAYLNVTPKNYAGAVGDFKAYLGKKPGDAVAWKDLAAAQYNNVVTPGQPFDKSKAPQLSEVITSATKATTLDSTLADAFLILADSLSLQEKFKEAIPSYSKYIALKPSEPYGYEGRGRVEYNTLDYKSAITDFEKFLKMKPGDAEITKLLAFARASAGGASASERITNLNEAIKADPNDPAAYTNRGVAYFEMGDFDKAAADFQKALDLKPTDPTYLNNLATALDKKAEKSGTDADRRSALAAYGKVSTPEAIIARANLNLQLKQWDAAIAEYTKLLATNPTKQDVIVGVYNNRAYCALQKTPPDFTLAIADYTKVIGLTPSDPAPYKVRGLAYLEQKNYPSGIADLEKYLQLNGNKDTDTVLSLASAYFNLGMSKRSQPGGGIAEFDKATSTYSLYLTLKPNEAPAIFSKGLAQFRKAQSQFTAKADKDALATLKKAMDDFELATKTKGDLADAWYYLGLAADTYGVKDELSQEDMFKKAIAAYEKFVSLPGVSPQDIKNQRARIEELKKALG